MFRFFKEYSFILKGVKVPFNHDSSHRYFTQKIIRQESRI